MPISIFPTVTLDLTRLLFRVNFDVSIEFARK